MLVSALIAATGRCLGGLNYSLGRAVVLLTTIDLTFNLLESRHHLLVLALHITQLLLQFFIFIDLLLVALIHFA